MCYEKSTQEPQIFFSCYSKEEFAIGCKYNKKEKKKKKEIKMKNTERERKRERGEEEKANFFSVIRRKIIVSI